VLDEQHGNLRRDGRQQRGDARALGGSEPSERFVEQQNPWPSGNGETHIEQALSAVGQRSRLCAFHTGEAEKGDKVLGLLVHLHHCGGRRPQREALGATGLNGEPQVLFG